MALTPRPNVLWICTDQQRYDTLGCTGNPFVNTPNLDRLAADGVLLRGAYSASPVCAPSRACFLSGRYPRTCGVRQKGQNIPSTERLIPRIFADNGYVCGLSGKLHISACHPSVSPDFERRIDDGYSFFSWSHHPAAAGRGNWSGNAYTNWLTEQGINYSTQDLPDCRYVQKGMPAEYSQTTWCFNEAMRFIGENRDRPWLFSINCYDPHHPFDPPEEYLKRYLPILDKLPLPDYIPGELDNKSVFQRYDHEGAYNSPGHFPYEQMSERDHRLIRAAYYAMIDQIDFQVGRIVEYLKKLGLYENTLIIFHSDHGESLGDHGIYLKGPYFYESAVHVPLILHWGGHTLRGACRDALVELVDLAPTLCEAAQLERPEAFQGRSFLPLVTDRNAPDKLRESVYSEFYNANINHRHPKAFLTMVSDGRMKLVKAHGEEGCGDPGSELYDLKTDPGEHRNLYGNPAFLEAQAKMLALLTDRMAGTLDPLPHRRAFW